MLEANYVTKPKTRGKFRKLLGKQYFIAKRKMIWLLKAHLYAKARPDQLLDHLVFEHSSILLRPLKDVDMQYQHNKIRNLELAIGQLNHIVIKPNQTFSLWYLVGKPSESKGYLKGLVLSNGKIGYDYGGGLCQLGNLIYWMLIHSPLTITERYRHGFDVFPDINRKLPFGSGATLSYNYIDLQFQNNTSQDFQLHLSLTKDKLHGAIRSSKPVNENYEVYESAHFIKHQSWGGYTRHNQLRRKILIDNEEAKDEFITENHAIMMYEPLLEEKNY